MAENPDAPETGDGMFEWQLSDDNNAARYAICRYDEDRYWGAVSSEPVDAASYHLPDWSIGPFTRHPGNPVLAPSPDGWDVGRYGGGVHFDKDSEHSPLFRTGDDAAFSFEDVSVAEWDGAFYLFCNRWDWTDPDNPGHNGTYLAVSTDLVHWEKVGLVFPTAEAIRRNGVVRQKPDNRAARAGGQFVVYLNEHLVATSDDMLHWTSHRIAQEHHWPGGEVCLALCDNGKPNPDALLLFTGGHNTGHFYAIGAKSCCPGPILSALSPGSRVRCWSPIPTSPGTMGGLPCRLTRRCRGFAVLSS